jgi:hypothetical protein
MVNLQLELMVLIFTKNLSRQTVSISKFTQLEMTTCMLRHGNVQGWMVRSPEIKLQVKKSGSLLILQVRKKKWRA